MQLQNGTCPRGRARSLPEHCPASGLRLLRRRGEGPHAPTEPLVEPAACIIPGRRFSTGNAVPSSRSSSGGGPFSSSSQESLPLASPLPPAWSLGLGPQVARELQAGLVLCLTMPEGSGASGLGPGGCLLGLAGMGCCDGLPPSCWGDGGLCRGPRGVRQGSGSGLCWVGPGGAGPGLGWGRHQPLQSLGYPSDLPQDLCVLRPLPGIPSSRPAQPPLT